MAYKRYPRRQIRGGKRKRGWYFDATIGRGVPLLGGTGVKFGKRGIQKIVRREALKSEETKKQVTAYGAVGFTHGTLYTFQMNNLLQGSLASNRVGDKVFYCGLNLKGQLTTTVSNSLWRFFIIKHRDSYNNTVGQWSSGIGASLMFRNGDTNPWSYVNSDDVQVLCAKTIKVDQKFAGESPIVREFRMNCRIMKNFQFRTGTSSEGEFYNYYAVMLPWSQVGSPTVGTTPVGNLMMSAEQIFKDA